MKMENSGLEGIQNTFSAIDPIMKKLGFYPAWDYHKVSYDIKLEEKGHNPEFYIRIPCKVLTGSVEHPGCEIELQSPEYFKHYYPHGMNFEAEGPQDLQRKAEKIVAQVRKRLTDLPQLQKQNP